MIVKTRGGRLRPVDVTTVQSLAGVFMLAPIAMLVEGLPAPASWPMRSWTALLYLAIGGWVLAFWLNDWLLERLEASAMLMMGVAEVPIAMLLGSAVLGERLALRSLVGAALVLCGVLVVLFSGRARAT